MTLNVTKSLILALALLCVTALVIASRTSFKDVDWFYSGVTLYALGNGIAVKSSGGVRSLIEPKAPSSDAPTSAAE